MAAAADVFLSFSVKHISYASYRVFVCLKYKTYRSLFNDSYLSKKERKIKTKKLRIIVSSVVMVFSLHFDNALLIVIKW